MVIYFYNNLLNLLSLAEYIFVTRAMQLQGQSGVLLENKCTVPGAFEQVERVRFLIKQTKAGIRYARFTFWYQQLIKVK